MDSIEKKNIVTAVYEKMISKIQDGSWKLGEKLPSEQELAEYFQVSRVSIRSSIQRLRDLGVVYTLHGRGSFISKSADKMSFEKPLPVMNLSKEEFEDMRIFRESVDFKCIELAALNATDDDIVELENALNLMLISKNDYKKYTEADFNFHLAIAKASKNKVFYHIIYSIKDTYKYYLEELNRVLGITLESIDAHIKIFMAIKNHNVENAILALGQAIDKNEIAITKLKEKN